LADVPAFVSYIEERAAAMPATVDRSHDLAGRHPAWEAASKLLALGYGRLGVALRVVLLDPSVRRLCTVARPSVVDGATGLSHWFRTGQSLRKVAADVRDFSNGDLYCYDPAFDLAGIDPGSRHTAFVEALRAAYPCSDERFLLYELVHLAARIDVDPVAGRAAARAIQRYVAARIPARPAASVDGPLCALDIDGVLESGSMGFPAITPAGMLSVRALAAHGYRPVAVTGRCLDEVRERCEAYGLAGGVAEYGALAYERDSGCVVDLVAERDRRLLATVRDTLRSKPNVVLDEDYRHSVRAYRRSETGLGPLTARMVETVLERLGGDRCRVRAIPGQRQTDFVARANDKGRGLEALARLFSHAAGVAPEIELAVGDTEADLPMLALAQHAFAPANASASVRASGVTVLRSSYSAAVAAAVGRLLGHPPGGCPSCRADRQSRETRLLLALLGAQAAGARGLPRAVLRGAVELIRARP
jgi:hydroxymethylpyrimidine pyrophosphatase-like HAD family hydrolase